MSAGRKPGTVAGHGLLAALCYIFASLMMTMSNKYAASVWRFPGSSFMLLMECLATVIAVGATAEAGRLKPFSKEILQRLPTLTLAKGLNMYLSFMAMRRTSIPVYNVLKRMNPVFAMGVDLAIRGVLPHPTERLGVVLICVGAVLTGAGDLEFDLVAYVVAITAAVGQSCYIVLARHATDTVKGLDQTDLLFYTAFFNLAIFTPLALWEAPEVNNFLLEPGKPTLVLTMLPPYIIMGAILNYTTFWCTTVNSPLATGVAGNFKGILSTGLGILFFGTSMAPIGWLGLTVSATGGLVYTLKQHPRFKSS